MKTSNERAVGQTSSRSWWGRLDAVLVLAAFLGLAATLPAKAQTASGGDPPSRVARLSEVSGHVWIYNDETDEWLTVGRNRPLTTGDRVATDKGARAEISLGSTTLRLDAGTEIEVALLDDSRYVVRLATGSVVARLRSPQALAEFAIDTDEGRFRVQTVGRYRFDRLDQASDLTVYNGQAAYQTKNTALPVYTGQHAQFWIDTAGVPQYAMVAPARDSFTAWNEDRDRGEDRVAANRFVSPEMTGAEDLVRYGQWEQTPDYGALWIPTSVPADWAPYSAGHWAWVRPWGWTWVDDAPWGFAPFHYGRWVYHRDAWCWAPGTYVARPVYAPALVAWVGGPRVGLSLSIGGGGPPVGWFPLAPREVYVPSYRASPRYVREVNITHVTNVTNITTIINNRNGEADRRDFANRRFPHAVTFVPSEVMTRREPVGPAAARLRNDPQLRAMVEDAKPAPAMIAAPVASPVVAPRPSASRQAPRPPFEGRAPENFAGRPDGARPDLGRAQGERQSRQPAVVGPGTSPAPVGAPQVGVPRNESVGRNAPPFGTNPGRSGQEGSNPAVVAPAVREGSPPPVAVVSAPTRAAPAADAMPPRMTIPSQRGVPAGEVGRVAPALRGRGGEGVNAETRKAVPQAAPQAGLPSLPIPNPPIPDGSTGRRPERMAPPRQVDPVRATEVPRPVAVLAAPQVAAPQPVTPRAEARPAEAARPVLREPRMTRPEAPRGRDDGREEKVDRPR